MYIIFPSNNECVARFYSLYGLWLCTRMKWIFQHYKFLSFLDASRKCQMFQAILKTFKNGSISSREFNVISTDWTAQLYVLPLYFLENLIWKKQPASQLALFISPCILLNILFHSEAFSVFYCVFCLLFGFEFESKGLISRRATFDDLLQMYVYIQAYIHPSPVPFN